MSLAGTAKVGAPETALGAGRSANRPGRAV